MDIPDPISAVPAPLPDDYQWAFDLAPIGLIVSRHRIIVACNQQVCSLFGTTPDVLLGQSFALLYPSVDEFHRMGERIFQPLVQRGSYQDERVMRRVGGRFAGQVFWCRVSGRALDHAVALFMRHRPSHRRRPRRSPPAVRPPRGLWPPRP